MEGKESVTRQSGPFRAAGPGALAALLTAVIAPAALSADAASDAHTLRLRSAEARLQPLPDAPAKRAAELRARIRAADAGRRFLIQLDAPLTPERRRQLAKAGVTLRGYTPPNAYVAGLDDADAEDVAALGFVRSVEAYAPSWKREAQLGRRPISNPDRLDLRARGLALVQIHLFPDASETERDALIDAINARKGGFVHNHVEVGGMEVVTAELGQGDADWLAEQHAIRFIEEAPEITLRTEDAVWVAQSDVPDHTPLWDSGLTGAGQVVAICDSGIDLTHCAFSSTPDKLVAYNGAPQVTPHGTSVASIAIGDPGFGDSPLRGHAYDARFVFSRIPSFTGDTLTTVLETQAGPDQGATVHNNSWGDDGTDAYTTLARAVDAFCHENEDQVVIFAVTNGGDLRSPENAKNAIAVAKGNNAPFQDQSCGGGLGLTPDGRIKPDLMAPGCQVESALSGSGCTDLGVTGTSFAAPLIAGQAALVRQYYVDGYHPSGQAKPSDGFIPSGALVKATLINGAVGGTSASYPDDISGWGRPITDEALFLDSPEGGEDKTPDARRLVVRDLRNEHGLTTGGFVEHAIEVTGDAEPLRVTLVWTDAPGPPGVQTAWVNDLDLQVTSPDGVTYLGNVFVGEESVAGGSPDFRNNVEQVRLSAPTTGEWSVRIVGSAVREGTQGYALVVTGEVADTPSPIALHATKAPQVLGPPPEMETIEVTIAPGDDAVVPGSAMLHYRFAGPAFISTPLTHVEGALYEAQLPDFPCGYTLEYYVSAEGESSGVRTAPPGGGEAWYRSVRGESETSVVSSFDFSAGLPSGWTATGLWHATSACDPGPGCAEGPWMYFGQDASCDYATGSIATGRLSAPLMILPEVGHGERLTLAYCTSIETENVSGFDRGDVLLQGLGVLDTPPDTGAAWVEREIDLTGFAGGGARFIWDFDSRDTFANGFRGWHVDNVELRMTTLDCTDAHPGDTNADQCVSLADFRPIGQNFGATDAVRWQGDLDADGDVDMSDFLLLAASFGAGCE